MSGICLDVKDLNWIVLVKFDVLVFGDYFYGLFMDGFEVSVFGLICEDIIVVY